MANRHWPTSSNSRPWIGRVIIGMVVVLMKMMMLIMMDLGSSQGIAGIAGIAGQGFWPTVRVSCSSTRRLYNRYIYCSDNGNICIYIFMLYASRPVVVARGQGKCLRPIWAPTPSSATTVSQVRRKKVATMDGLAIPVRSACRQLGLTARREISFFTSTKHIGGQSAATHQFAHWLNLTDFFGRRGDEGRQKRLVLWRVAFCVGFLVFFWDSLAERSQGPSLVQTTDWTEKLAFIVASLLARSCPMAEKKTDKFGPQRQTEATVATVFISS